MIENGGYIYVLTNPSFPKYIKIGYADDVEKRVHELNRTECTPFAFRLYATLHVSERLADLSIHQIIDWAKPELRSKENINGKMRIREFYDMSPEEAFNLLKVIGHMYGETPKHAKSSEKEQDEKLVTEVTHTSKRQSRSPFSFHKCGIRDGEEIVFVNDPSIICKVIGNREISYNDKKTSLSALAQKLLQLNHPVQGTLYFTYKNEVLDTLRKRLEDEGKYNEVAKEKAENTIQN